MEDKRKQRIERTQSRIVAAIEAYIGKRIDRSTACINQIDFLKAVGDRKKLIALEIATELHTPKGKPRA